MRKNVVISLPGNSSYFPGLKRAFNYLGWESHFFDFRKFSLKEKYLSIITKNQDQAITSLNLRLQNYLKKKTPELFFVMKGETIQQETLKLAQEMGIFTVNWFPDYVNAFELALKLSIHYDFFFHFDPLSVFRLNKEGRNNVYYLPFAADILPSDSKPLINEKKYKISFIGNYDNYREEYLKSVCDLGLNIWGDNRWAKSVLSHCYRGSQLPNFKFAEVSGSSKININIQHEDPCDGLVLRVFEVLGAGAFLLTESNKDVDKLFKDSVATFGSSKELRNKIIYFLTHGKERDKISNEGYLAVKTRHTYLHRIREVLSYNPSY